MFIDSRCREFGEHFFCHCPDHEAELREDLKAVADERAEYARRAAALKTSLEEAAGELAYAQRSAATLVTERDRLEARLEESEAARQQGWNRANEMTDLARDLAAALDEMSGGSLRHWAGKPMHDLRDRARALGVMP